MIVVLQKLIERAEDPAPNTFKVLLAFYLGSVLVCIQISAFQGDCARNTRKGLSR